MDDLTIFAKALHLGKAYLNIMRPMEDIGMLSNYYALNGYLFLMMAKLPKRRFREAGKDNH